MKLLILLLGLLMTLIATELNAEPSQLRESIVVSGDRIRLGDIFTNPGDKAETAVAYAPEPGQRSVLDAQWLYRVARYYGIDWRPLGNRDRSIVVRESHVIGEEELADYVLAALAEQGADPDMRVGFSTRGQRLYVESASQASVDVEYATYDPRSRRFTAVVSAPANDPSAPRLHVSGQLYKMLEVPVLARTKGIDEVIREDDLKWLKLPNDQVRRDVIVDADELVGMAARRSLRPDQPIRTSEVKKPILVEKNALVTMVLESGSMMLTVKGKALEGGSEGETIRVTNVQSKTVIEAVVTGPGRVAVTSGSRFAQLTRK